MVRQAFDNPYDNASDPGSAIAGRTAGQNANYAKMYEFSVTIKITVGGVSGLNMIAARLSPGAISDSSSSHLPDTRERP
jgi:hypothetical protein